MNGLLALVSTMACTLVVGMAEAQEREGTLVDPWADESSESPPDSATPETKPEPVEQMDDPEPVGPADQPHTPEPIGPVDDAEPIGPAPGPVIDQTPSLPVPSHPSGVTGRTRVRVVDRSSDVLDDGPPPAQFVSLERATQVSRIGAQVGAGGSTNDTHSVERMTVYGNYVWRGFGLYAQVDGSRLRTMDMSRSGRVTGLVAATYAVPVAGGYLMPRFGIAVPLSNDTQEGFEAAAASSYQRVADAALSLPSTTTLRSGASWSQTGRYWTVQADAGIDWVAGGPEETLRPYGRGNLGIGLGIRSVMWTLELSNTVRMSDSNHRLHAIGTGGLLWIHGVWAHALISRTNDQNTVGVFGLGYAF